ncbi:E3 ubiquitin-protein ligase [Caligus rogercresseyi]|uniref:E3 ubiquitin-protein ligase n=1 Tax=Caligus rogercresseyi TaxID=217165 RepID=A0A7T8GV40_CALRO|nr:E3 ubiquitin-protein ligase [Caligus rogercresseyi]
MSELNTEDRQNILRDLQSRLECPVCFNTIIAPPIFQCVAGHMLCSPCNEKLSSCPICRQRLTNMRLLFAEQMLETLPRKCSFQHRGCSFEGFNVLTREHEERCAFAPLGYKYDLALKVVRCPIEDCQRPEVLTSNFNEHLERNHAKYYIKPLLASSSFSWPKAAAAAADGTPTHGSAYHSTLMAC